ncbi:tannase/feruloyl esterase family alpha/beta hydrolase [Caldimonas manganoxidans]|uniref:tannase/feruloyl esterase family alpha/beta hydrolase n=1 Tax=Caldimonas manganoxidans TaxID=196015 RepID=UPI00037603FF|nr:tannase/feruloyl esterase family alpha/beta hydrolase [Caldimonas manganoxidans]
MRPRSHAASVSALTGALVLTAIAQTACGGGSDPSTTDIPQLPPATPARFSGDCAALSSALAGLPNTTLTETSTVSAGTLSVGGAPVAEHCLVRGRMFERTSPIDGASYAIGFEMRLPKDWNGRFYYQANGGLDGIVVTATGSHGGGPRTHALHQGFAVLSSDAGHSAAQNPSFGRDPQARLDYGYQAVGKLTPVAKEIIRRVYGKGPDRSYIGGCSNGGRHAMVAASRYATEYDGYLIGAPGFNLPLAAVANIWGAQRYATVATDASDLSTAFTAQERQLVSQAILDRCDALDGATDGLVQDTAACQATFDLMRDVPTCAGARDGSCLSADQKSVIASIFAGATTSAGTRFYASFPYDPGLRGARVAFWEFTAPLALDSGAVGIVFKAPPENLAGFNGASFSLNTPVDTLYEYIHSTSLSYTESAMSFMTPPRPSDWSTLRNRGAKALVYHGVSDHIFSLHDTLRWYDALNANHGGQAARFARVFPVPGMGHCSGGPATDQFDLLTPLVQWVEQGTVPERIVASARGAGNPGGVNNELPSDWAADRTRPLCPYPQVARYRGSGDLDRADSFVCQ